MSHKTETPKNVPHIIIAGCGRLGAELALSLTHQHYNVAIIDSNRRAFEQLGNNFSGQTVEGDALDQDTLIRAGIKNCYGFTAVTTSDSINIVACRIARDVHAVTRVVARLYNPSRAAIYQKLNLQTIASSSWGAQRIEQMILNPNLQSVYSVGNGEVHVYELVIPPTFAKKRAHELFTDAEAVATGLTRAGRTQLITPDTLFEIQDVVLVTATAAGARRLHSLLEGKA